MVCAGVAIALCVSFILERLDIPPRQLSPYIERRASGHNPLIEDVGHWVGRALLNLDRGKTQPHIIQPLTIGAQASATPPNPVPGLNSITVFVSSPDEIITAIAHARPGDVITLMPGTYYFEKRTYIAVNQGGLESAPVTLRAERPGTVFLEFNMSEGFKVSAPYWTFENLHIRGVCQQQTNCEHAFHVVGEAAHFVARNNTIVDFNAHFKINGEGNIFPDYGLIAGNTLTNSRVRQTANPVTSIDLVAASHWQIQRNLITDFIKAQGDKISYGAFAKGEGSDNSFEKNIVLCENMLQGTPGQRVGLSLGGGGTGETFCRNRRCITEQNGGVIRSNLIAYCSDDGIYINRSAANKILHNTLIDTGGISVRFVESSSVVQGNLVDGLIRARDGGVLHLTDNHSANTTSLYLGLHPIRDLYVNAAAMDLAWKESPPNRVVAGAVPLDLCGAPRSTHPAYGAFEDFSACLVSSK